ncbi:MAG TPA: hypothetical protein VFQ22_07375 [Longimicrobiales bacterium]|nr:hypothetical protein [Longimicrobiales bacterium]
MGGAAELARGQVELVPVDLVPGSYVALCFVSDAGDGLPHVAHGMVMPFEIS